MKKGGLHFCLVFYKFGIQFQICKMIQRQAKEKIEDLARQFKAVAVMGPRQSGKTTLTRLCFPEKAYVTLENPSTRSFALEDPQGFLDQYESGAILDEIQRAPDLLSYLQQRLDESEERGKYILTGSNNLLLLEKITQTLAGRVAYLELLPLSIAELRSVEGALSSLNTHVLKGGYPSIQAQGINPEDWFAAYVRTYVERDVRQVRNVENLLQFERLLALCAGRVGQQLNYSNLAVETGVDIKTVQAWLGVLQASYIVFLLPPFFRNFNKRVTKSPKLYFYDTGLVSYLLRIQNAEALFQHPYRGALFENLVVSELLKNRFNRGRRSNLYYWRDNAGHEIDVVVDNGLEMIPIEAKSGSTITGDFFKGLAYWQKLAETTQGIVFYGGDEPQERSTGFKVAPWRTLGEY